MQSGAQERGTVVVGGPLIGFAPRLRWPLRTSPIPIPRCSRNSIALMLAVVVKLVVALKVAVREK